MQFNREMIHTVRRISKLVREPTGSDFKLSNPELLANLRGLYNASHSEEIKSLVERFFELAEKDLSPEDSKSAKPDRVYRGSIVVSGNAIEPSPEKSSTTKKKLTYRGREFEV